MFLVEVDQYGAVLVGTWWYWVSITLYCLVLSGTGLENGLKMEIWLGATIAGQTNKQKNMET